MRDQLRQVRKASGDLAAATRRRNDAIQVASEAGIPLRTIAAAAGLSHQRVHQIVRGS